VAERGVVLGKEMIGLYFGNRQEYIGMKDLVQVIFSSLEIGSIYALASLGIIIIFRTAKMTNFAQGATGMFNAYVATFFLIKTGLPTVVAVLVGMLSAFILGTCIDFLIIRRVKNKASISLQIVTLGLVLILTGLAPLLFGGNPLAFPRFIQNASITIFGASIMVNAILSIGIGIGILALVFLFLQKTKWGLAVRVTASNSATAKLMGVPTSLVNMGAWAVAAALGTLSALMLAPSTVVDIIMMDGVQLMALIACVLGGFQTFYGPIVGAYIIGLSKNLITFYISSTWGTAINYALILVFIIFMPNGIFGKKQVKKV
jgi:Branched-chain amino acid ABC-type transport system, permease components